MDILMENRGRKPKDKVVRESRMTLKFSEEEIQKIENMAAYLDIPKTVAARNLLLYGLEAIETMQHDKLLEPSKGIIKTSEWLECVMKK